MSRHEKYQIVKQLVIDGIKMGYTVSIEGGGGKYAIRKSTNVNEIVPALLDTASNEILQSMMTITYGIKHNVFY